MSTFLEIGRTLAEKEWAVRTLPRQFVREMISRCTEKGRIETAERMEHSARHESGHILCVLALHWGRIVEFRVSSLQNRTIEALVALFGSQAYWLGTYRPCSGSIRCIENKEHHCSWDEKNHVLIDLAGMVAEDNGKSTDELRRDEMDVEPDYRFPTEYVGEFLRKKFPQYARDHVVRHCIGVIMKKLAEVFAKQAFQTSIEHLTHYIATIRSDRGPCVHGDVLRHLADHGIGREMLIEMGRELEGIDVRQLLTDFLEAASRSRDRSG